MEDRPSWTSQLMATAAVALSSFVGTFLALTLAGIFLAGVSYWFLHDESWGYGLGAAALALIEALAAGLVLGTKRGVVLALAHGFGSLRLGAALVRAVFERMGGGLVAQGLERLPLGQAENVLGDAVRGAMGEGEEGGYLGRTMRARLLNAVSSYTLARFRTEDARYGGVHLETLQEELEANVDDVLAVKLRRALRVWTMLVLLGLLLIVAAQIAACRFMSS